MILKSTLGSSNTQPNVRRQVRPTPKEQTLPTARQLRRDDSKRQRPAPPKPEIPVKHAADPAEKKERQLAWKMIGVIILIGIAGLAYLNHVFATQAILKEVSTLEREFEKMRRIHADRKFTFERMTGPSEVYERARQQGLVHGGAAEGVIVVKP